MQEITRMARAMAVCGIALSLAGCDDALVATAAPAERAIARQVASAPVVNSLGDGVYDGTCTDTFCTLRAAIDFATEGAVITFAPGLTGTVTASGGNINVAKSLTITGPGASTLAVTSNGESVFNISSTGATVSISGLTIRGSTAGSAVNNSGTTTITNCVIRDNNTGAIYNAPPAAYNGGTLHIVESTITANSAAATEVPGAIENLGTLTITRSTISGNSTAGAGGAIRNAWYYDSGVLTYGTVTITNSTISGNTATGVGGAIYNQANLTLVNSTVTGNASSADGGGISQQHNLTLTNTIIAGNSAPVGPDIRNYFEAVTTSDHGLIGSASEHNIVNGVNGNIVGVATADLHLGTLADNGGPTPTLALLAGSPALDAGTGTGCPATDQRGITRPQGSACDIGAYEKEGGGGLPAPTFTFDLSGLPTKTFGDGSFSVAGYTTTNSSGTITFSTGTGSVGCSVTDAGSVSITGAATGTSYCIVEASLATDGTYAAAGPLSQSFNIAKAAGSVSIDNIPSGATVGGSFTPTYAKSGNGTASVISTTTGTCTVSDGVVSFVAAGECTLRPSVTEGANHLAATGTDQGFTISAASAFSSSCTYTVNLRNGGRAVTVTWADASPGVTQVEVTDGRVITKQMAPTVAGSVNVNVRTGVPAYRIWGGATRKDVSHEWVTAGTCTEQ